MSELDTQLQSHLTREQLGARINALLPEKQYSYGRKFFQRLLDEQGVDGVLSFIGKASSILAQNKKPDHTDFTQEELQIIKRLWPSMTRREFLVGTLSPALGGIGLGSYGGLGVAHQIVSLGSGKPLIPPHKTEDGFEAAQHVVESTVMPSIYTLMGIEMFLYGSDTLNRQKLINIVNAAEKLVAHCDSTGPRASAMSR